MSAFVLTWNCNTAEPSKLTLKDKDKLLNIPVETVDIIVICLQ